MRDEYITENGPFELDAMLPSQFFAALRQKPPAGPEYLLAAAVLEEAIDCFQKHCDTRDPKTRRLFEDAAEWIASDDRVWPFSYVNICELLDLHPEYVRSGLRSWRESRRQARTPRGRRVAGGAPFRSGCVSAAGKLN
jgi:hypothetical protein